MAQPVWAATTVVTEIRLKPAERGIELVLNTKGNNRPPVFTFSRANSTVADLTDTQLRLPEGKIFRQDNPAPGITSVAVSQSNPNTIRVIVSGSAKAPAAQVMRREGPGVILGFKQVSSSTIAQANTPAAPPPSKSPNRAPRPNLTPPVLPRAVAPPVGDITVSPVDATPSTIDLGTSERIPRLLLREAPVQEVLTMLARAANLNLVYATNTESGTSTQSQQSQGEAQPGSVGQAQQPQGVATSQGPKISLDIENEPVQDVFNYVLRLSGLEANRVGRTIFVGPRLPDTARNLVTRTYRLNQVSAAAAASFLTAQGAVTQITRDRVAIESFGEGAAARVIETRTPEVLALRAEAGDGPLLLRGLSVLTSERLNSITLVGDPRKIEIASKFLTQLDLR
ncbi:MAG TPA: AMIN domain-containing protein, partial [Candidatus Caenarcaniphilales bacterium]